MKRMGKLEIAWGEQEVPQLFAFPSPPSELPANGTLVRAAGPSPTASTLAGGAGMCLGSGHSVFVLQNSTRCHVITAQIKSSTRSISQLYLGLAAASSRPHQGLACVAGEVLALMFLITGGSFTKPGCDPVPAKHV